MARNYAGLVQIRNYAKYGTFLKEVFLLIKYRPMNLLSLRFWFFSLGLAITPRSILIPMVDYYKNKLNSKKLSDIHLFGAEIKDEKPYSENYYVETGYANFEKGNRMDHQGIIDFGKIKKSERVLEIGCGLGALLLRLNAKEKYGLESNNFAVEVCKKKGLKVSLHDDSYELPYKDKFFDVVIMNEVIEHIPEPAKILLEIKRVIKDNGRLILTTPAKNFWVNNLAETHCSEMSYKELKQVVSETGFSIKLHKVRGLSYYDFIGRKIVFPLGRFLLRRKIFSGSVSSAREKIDSSNISRFRDNWISFACQQLLIANKK